MQLGGLLVLMCGLESGYAAALGALILRMIWGGLVAPPLLFMGPLHSGSLVPVKLSNSTLLV